ncbi:MAG: PAS domain-containing protein [Sedimentisphaerales bacterium]|nr:PAS domain-containing protein [Sedimentisphaerales bacterium]
MFLARKLVLVLVILTALGGSAAYFVTRMGLISSAGQARNLGWTVFALLTLLSLILAALIWKNVSSSLRKVCTQLKHFESEDEIGMIMIDERDELAELVDAVNHHLTRIEAKLRRDRILQKELEIQARVAEAERRQREAVIFSISQAVLVTDKYDELILANQSAEKLFQFELNNNYRKSITQVIHDDKLVELIRQTRLQKNTRVTQLFERADHQRQKTLSLEIFLSCVLDYQDEILGVVVVIHDVTAEKEIARIKDDFVNSVSHELKTPLASISACAEMLEDDEAADKQSRHELIGIVREQAQRLNRLIDNILNLSRIESGMFKAHKENLNLTDLVRQVISAMRPQAAEKNITINQEINCTELLIFADPDMLHQALMNLLSNAVKYSHPGQSVSVVLNQKDDQHVLLQVNDHGAGIPTENLNQIFEKFYRVRQNCDLAGGTGLGLHLVRKIIETIHNGRVSVTSHPEKGSCFSVSLPLCRQTKPVAV